MQPRQRPGGVFPYQCLCIVQQALQERHKSGIPRIAHRYTDIAEQTTALGALDGCILKTLLKLLTSQVDEVFQAWVHLSRMWL